MKIEPRAPETGTRRGAPPLVIFREHPTMFRDTRLGRTKAQVLTYALGSAQRVRRLLKAVASSLVGKFALNPDYSLRSGAISGAASGPSTAVGVDPVPDNAFGSIVAISGMYGPTKVASTAGVPSGNPFSVVGTVDGRKVRFDVTNPRIRGAGPGVPDTSVTATTADRPICSR